MFSRNEGFEVIDETHEYVVVEDLKAQRKKSILKYLIVVVMAVLGYFALTTDNTEASNEDIVNQAINGADVFDDISECWNTCCNYETFGCLNFEDCSKGGHLDRACVGFMRTYNKACNEHQGASCETNYLECINGECMDFNTCPDASGEGADVSCAMQVLDNNVACNKMNRTTSCPIDCPAQKCPPKQG